MHGELRKPWVNVERVEEVLSECVLLTSVQPCQELQCLRPMQVAKSPFRVGLWGWTKPSSGSIVNFGSVQSLAAAASSSQMTATRDCCPTEIYGAWLYPSACAGHNRIAKLLGCCCLVGVPAEWAPLFSSCVCASVLSSLFSSFISSFFHCPNQVSQDQAL